MHTAATTTGWFPSDSSLSPSALPDFDGVACLSHHPTAGLSHLHQASPPKLHSRLICRLELLAIGSRSDVELHEQIRRGAERENLIAEVFDDCIGLGPLDLSLQHTSSAILIHGQFATCRERSGIPGKSPVLFSSADHWMSSLQRYRQPAGGVGRHHPPRGGCVAGSWQPGQRQPSAPRARRFPRLHPAISQSSPTVGGSDRAAVGRARNLPAIGIRPKLLEPLEAMGAWLPVSMFEPRILMTC